MFASPLLSLICALGFTSREGRALTAVLIVKQLETQPLTIDILMSSYEAYLHKEHAFNF